VFTEPLLKNGLHNPVVPPLLGTDDIENTASSIVSFWNVFKELLPGNVLIKSVTFLLLNRTARIGVNYFMEARATVAMEV
jgi:hypothetical protein